MDGSLHSLSDLTNTHFFGSALGVVHLLAHHGGGARAIFASEMVRIGEDEVGGGSAAKPLNFIGKFLLQRRSRRLGGGSKTIIW